nr:MAG TPA: hypothetical protein [Bacteriophage sp.]
MLSVLLLQAVLRFGSTLLVDLMLMVNLAHMYQMCRHLHCIQKLINLLSIRQQISRDSIGCSIRFGQQQQTSWMKRLLKTRRAATLFLSL